MTVRQLLENIKQLRREGAINLETEIAICYQRSRDDVYWDEELPIHRLEVEKASKSSHLKKEKQYLKLFN